MQPPELGKDRDGLTLSIGDRVVYPGVEVDICGTLQDIQEGVGVVLWDNGVTKTVDLGLLRKLEER